MLDEVAAEQSERRRHGCTVATAGFSVVIRIPANSLLMSFLLAS
jgi:hypothetical protein